MSEVDQTARNYTGTYRDKKVLVIGSGDDLDGRQLGGIIDIKPEEGGYDIVCRVNKHYGSKEDVGTRTDVIITRWNAWLDNTDWFTEEEQAQAKEIVVLNQHMGFSRTEYEWLRAQVGTEAVSAGPQALAYFLNRGAAQIDVIGFGYKDGAFNKAKVYTTGSKGTTPEHNTEGQVDKNPTYDWHAEKVWAVNQSRINYLN